MEQSQALLDTVQFLLFIVAVSIIQSLLALRFMGKFSEKNVKSQHYIFYSFASFAISVMEIALHGMPFSLAILALRIALLWCVGVLLLKCQPAVSLLTAIVAETINLLSAGISASLTFSLMATQAIFKQGVVMGFVLSVLGQIITFALIIVAYQIILKRFKWRGVLPSQYLAIFFLPVLMILIVEQFIFNQVYGNVIIIDSERIIKPVAEHWQVLLIQLFGCFCLLSTLYACKKLTEDFSNRTKLLLLERETTAQQDYLEESRARNEQTQSFRHDINNHLLALEGLIERGEIEKARAYLGRLKDISERLSFPCKTGSTVVDTVLGSKLCLAQQNGIHVECTVKIPQPCIVNDLDWCVLFSNAVDNALHACGELADGTGFIRISGRQKGDFFMVEIENSCIDGTYSKGIGLTNIDAVSEKYHGAVTTEKQGDTFRLNVLLVISRHLDDI